jgi:transposase-like protein
MNVSYIEKTPKDIRHNTRPKFSTEEKILIVLDGLRGQSSVAELCRKKGINLKRRLVRLTLYGMRCWETASVIITTTPTWVRSTLMSR